MRERVEKWTCWAGLHHRWFRANLDKLHINSVLKYTKIILIINVLLFTTYVCIRTHKVKIKYISHKQLVPYFPIATDRLLGGSPGGISVSKNGGGGLWNFRSALVLVWPIIIFMFLFYIEVFVVGATLFIFDAILHLLFKDTRPPHPLQICI